MNEELSQRILSREQMQYKVKIDALQHEGKELNKGDVESFSNLSPQSLMELLDRGWIEVAEGKAKKK